MNLNNQSVYTHKIKEVYSTLRASEKTVADYVSNNPDNAINLSLLELSKKIGVSEPSIIRFIKAVGYKGFNDFKIKVAQDLGQMSIIQQDPFADIQISKGEDTKNLPQKIISNTILSLQETLQILNTDQLESAIASIKEAKIIDIYGVGNSAIIAEDLVHKLMRLGIYARSFADPHIQIMSACNLTDKDIAIAVSHSGKTKDIIDSIKVAKKTGAKVIVITNYQANEIKGLADICLLTGSFETSYYSETMLSRISQLSIIDMIYTGILLSNYDNSISKIDLLNAELSEKTI